MTSSASLISDLFHTKHPLYFQPTQADKTLTVVPESERSTLKFFKCGSVQAPYYGFRDIHVRDVEDNKKNALACSMTLSGIIQLMRSHAATDKSAHKLFEHPDQSQIREKIKDDPKAIENGRYIQNGFLFGKFRITNPDNNPIVAAVTATLDVISLNYSMDRREHSPLYFDVDPKYGYKMRSMGGNAKTDMELCCQIPIQTAVYGTDSSKKSVIATGEKVYEIKPDMGKVYIASADKQSCPELCDFIRSIKSLSDKGKAEENFPDFKRA